MAVRHHSSPVRPVIRTGARVLAPCAYRWAIKQRRVADVPAWEREKWKRRLWLSHFCAQYIHMHVRARARSFTVLLSVRFFLVTAATAVTERHRLIIFPSKASNDIFQWLVMPISFVRDFCLPNDRAPAIRRAENVSSPASFQKWTSNIHIFFFLESDHVQFSRCLRRHRLNNVDDR